MANLADVPDHHFGYSRAAGDDTCQSGGVDPVRCISLNEMRETASCDAPSLGRRISKLLV